MRGATYKFDVGGRGVADHGRGGGGRGGRLGRGGRRVRRGVICDRPCAALAGTHVGLKPGLGQHTVQCTARAASIAQTLPWWRRLELVMRSSSLQTRSSKALPAVEQTIARLHSSFDRERRWIGRIRSGRALQTFYGGTRSLPGERRMNRASMDVAAATEEPILSRSIWNPRFQKQCSWAGAALSASSVLLPSSCVPSYMYEQHAGRQYVSSTIQRDTNL